MTELRTTYISTESLNNLHSIILTDAAYALDADIKNTCELLRTTAASYKDADFKNVNEEWASATITLSTIRQALKDLELNLTKEIETIRQLKRLEIEQKNGSR